MNEFLFKILGDYEPNDDECEWPSDEEDDELAGDMKVKAFFWYDHFRFRKKFSWIYLLSFNFEFTCPTIRQST